MTTQPNQKDAYRLLHQGILAFSRAEQQGIGIDITYCTYMEQELSLQIRNRETEFYATKFYRHWRHTLGGKYPNINSNAQLSSFLYAVKKLKPTKDTVTGQGATDEEALEALGIPEIKTLLQIRKLKKLRDTYLRGFLKEQVNGKLHPNFNLHIARTYRSSSDRPNFQNIPKRDIQAQEICRRAIIPSPGNMLLEADYSGIEVAIAACLSFVRQTWQSGRAFGKGKTACILQDTNPLVLFVGKRKSQLATSCQGWQGQEPSKGRNVAVGGGAGFLWVGLRRRR